MKKYKDHYFQRAKQEAYPARSVYKLKEIQKKFALFQAGQSVLDLGTAPGSWALYAAEKIGPGGSLLGVDLQAIDQDWPKQVRFIQADILQPDPVLAKALESMRPFDVICSDMAPKTTGIKLRDQTLSFELAQAAFDCCSDYLIGGGSFVTKIFDGPDVPELLVQMRQAFAKVKGFKPKSSREESKERFLIGLGHQNVVQFEENSRY